MRPISTNPAIATERRGRRGRALVRERYSHHDHDSVSIGLFAGGGRWGFGFGYDHHDYYGGSDVSISFGFGSGPWYCGAYLHGAAYRSAWNYYYWGYGPLTPYHLPYTTTAWTVYSGLYAPVYRSFYHASRFSFGFSYYYPYARYTPYPFYRRVWYEPYWVAATSYVCPTYRTYYYVNDYTTTYVDTTDPYVEQDLVVDVDVVDDAGAVFAGAVAAPVSSGLLSADFAGSFVEDFPDDLDYEGLLAWGEDALYAADYLSAAEAFRRAALDRPTEDYPKFQLAIALFGAGRFDLGAEALRRGLVQNSAWVYRRFHVSDGFANREEFDARVADLERYLIAHDRDADARFLLGYVYFFSGNLFGARSVLRTLEEAGYEAPGLEAMAREAERRLVRESAK